MSGRCQKEGKQGKKYQKSHRFVLFSYLDFYSKRNVNKIIILRSNPDSSIEFIFITILCNFSLKGKINLLLNFHLTHHAYLESFLTLLCNFSSFR